MDAMQCLLERRSTRDFLSDPVDRETLKSIINAGMFAPSGMNGQPWLFTVISDDAVLKRINGAVKAAFADSQDAVLIKRSKDDSYCCYYGAPVLVIVSCEKDYRFAKQDTACALENIFLAATAHGLGSCWINQLCNGNSDTPRIRAALDELQVPSNHDVYGCAAIGYVKTPTQVKPRRAEVKYFERQIVK